MKTIAAIATIAVAAYLVGMSGLPGDLFVALGEWVF